MTQEPKIKGIVIIFSSKPDSNGNVYYAARFIRTMDGAKVAGLVDHKSNSEHALLEICGNWDNIVTSEVQMPIRQWNRYTKNFQYMGGSHEELMNAILEGWNNPEN